MLFLSYCNQLWIKFHKINTVLPELQKLNYNINLCSKSLLQVTGKWIKWSFVKKSFDRVDYKSLQARLFFLEQHSFVISSRRKFRKSLKNLQKYKTFKMHFFISESFQRQYIRKINFLQGCGLLLWHS